MELNNFLINDYIAFK